jgi:hypothetical protein
VQTDRDGVHEDDGTDTWRYVGVVQEMGGDDGAVGMRDEDEFLVGWEILIEDLGDFSTGFFPGETGVREPEADVHDFESDDADYVVGFGVQFVEEGGVWVETNADAVDEDDGKLSFRGMWTVPVADVGGRGAVGRPEAVRPDRKNAERLFDRRSMKVKAVKAQRAACQEVHKPNTLSTNTLAILPPFSHPCSVMKTSTHKIPTQTPMRHNNLIQRQPQALSITPPLLNLPPQLLLQSSNIPLQLLIIVPWRPTSIKKRPQEKLLYIFPLNLLDIRTQKPFLQIRFGIYDILAAVPVKFFSFCTGGSRWMDSFALQPDTVRQEAEEEEDGFNQEPALERERQSTSLVVEEVGCRNA